MLNQLNKSLSNALFDVIHRPTKTNLSEIDFSLGTGINTVTIRGSHKFKVLVDEESTRGGWRSQTLTALIYDADCQEMALPQLKITQDGRLTKIWLCVNERTNTFSDLKEKIVHSPEEIAAAQERFLAIYSKVKSYLEAPSLPQLAENLDILIKLNAACAKCKKLGLRTVNGLNLDDILGFTYESRAEGKRILEVWEQAGLSKPKPLSQFGYIKKKGFPEKELSRFGNFPSTTERNAAGGLENALAIPLYADLQGRLVGFQSITSDGGKKYHTLKGTKAAGAFAVLGSLDAYQAGAITLCEGVATGLAYALAVPDARVLVTLDTHGLKACTRLFVDRELVHALDNDTRIYSERNKKNAGVESSLAIESALRAAGKQPTITRIAPTGSGQFKIDFDDLRQAFKNDFTKLKENFSNTKFVFSPVTAQDDKSAYFTHSRYNDPSFLPDFTSPEAITLSINSPTGSGKTTLLKQITSSVNSAIYVCPRVSLTSQAASDLGLWLYRDLIDTQDKYLPSFDNGLKAATTMHSLWKLLEKIESAQDIECLILDECDQIFSDLKNIENKEAQQRLNGLFSAMTRARKVVLLSATMTKPLLDALRAVRPLATNLHIYNTCVKNRGSARVYRGVKVGQVYDKLVRKTAKGADTIAFSSDRAGILQKNFDDLKEHFPERRALLCTRERFEFSFASDLSEREIESQFLANPDEFLEQYQVDTLFYSPILQTGFSIEKEFAYQFFDYSLDDIQPKSQLQQTMRIRNAKQRIGSCLSRNALNFQSIDDLKKEFVESRKIKLIENAQEYRYKNYKDSALAATFEEIAQMIERAAAVYELSEQEEIVFSQIYSDKLEYTDYFESFTKHLENNGLDVEICEEIEEQSTGYILPKNDLKFEQCVEKFQENDQDDAFLQAIKKTHTTTIGLRTERTAGALELAENAQGLARDELTLERLTIYKNPKKYLESARNFLILKDNPFAETYKLAQAPMTQEEARSEDGLLGKVAFVRELLTALAAQDDKVLLGFFKNARMTQKQVNRKKMRVDLLKGLFGIGLKKGEQLTLEKAQAIAHKILGLFGLGLDKIHDDNYMTFWEAFTQELKPIFTSELNALFNLKENPFISYSDTENSSHTQVSFFYNKSSLWKLGNDDGSKSSQFKVCSLESTKFCSHTTQDSERNDHSQMSNCYSNARKKNEI